MDRRINFGRKITLNWKPVRGIGLRETILLTTAALQAVYLIFVADSIVFAVRLCLALFVAVTLMVVATVPIRGYRIEHFAWIVLRGWLRPKRYLHQTAERNMAPLAEIGEDERRATDDGTRRPRVALAMAPGDWAGPNVAVVMALFVCLLFGAAIAVYVVSGEVRVW